MLRLRRGIWIITHRKEIHSLSFQADWSCLDDLTFLNVFAGSHGRRHGRASVGRSMDSHFLIYFFPRYFAPVSGKAKGSV